MKGMMEESRDSMEEVILADLAAEVEAATVSETIKPQSRVDRYLKIAAITLAVGCAMLPFVTYLQQVNLIPDKKADSKIVDPLDRSEQKSVRHFPSFRPNDQVALSEHVDTTTTGSLLSNGKGLPGTGADTSGEGGDGRALPKPVFALREVVGGMALIEDMSGYWFVEKGSLLPDGSHLVSIGRGDQAGMWKLTTSSGDVIEMSK